jgi:hypothetical protein
MRADDTIRVLESPVHQRVERMKPMLILAV